MGELRRTAYIIDEQLSNMTIIQHNLHTGLTRGLLTQADLFNKRDAGAEELYRKNPDKSPLLLSIFFNILLFHRYHNRYP